MASVGSSTIKRLAGYGVRSKRDWPGSVQSAAKQALRFQPPAPQEADLQQSGRAGTLKHGGQLYPSEDKQVTETVETLDILVQRGSYVPPSLYCRVLRECTAYKDVAAGRWIHALTLESGDQSNIFLANHIIQMYAAYGSLEEATGVFTKLPAPNSYSWFFMILSHAERGQYMQAIELYEQMRESPVKPNDHIFAAILKACATAKNLASGKKIHADLLSRMVQPDLFVGSCLVDMYAKCGSFEDAQRVFDSLGVRDVVTWNALISGYSEHGLGQEALTLYARMQQEGISKANRVTFLCLLKACASIKALREGKALHLQIQDTGLEADFMIGNSLVDMYAKCGSLQDARRVFDALPRKDVMVWTAMIAGYADNGCGQEALALYADMQQQGVTLADRVTFVCLLKACGASGAIHEGRRIHSQIRERQLEADVVVGNCLVDMYAKCCSLEDARKVFDGLETKDAVSCTAMIAGYARCGSLEDARKLFDQFPRKDVVTWNAMLAGYAEHGLGREALSLYAFMCEEGTTQPSCVTFVCLLKASASLGALQEGKELHREILARGLESDVVVGNTLVDMYAKCGSLEDARRVFDMLPARDVVTWNTLIAANAKHGLGQEALALYASMQQDGVSVISPVTYTCLLNACASVGAVCQGQQLHAEIQERGLQGDLIVGNSLVDMYAKCGCLKEAREVFDRLPSKDVVTWNALLNGYAQHSASKLALECFQEMQKHGVAPNEATFTSVLVACSHQGLVDEAHQYLKSMVEDHDISPTVQHYNCLVDVLGRSGRLHEAELMLQTLPFQTNVVGWTSLLTACRSHGDAERGERCFHQLTTFDPQSTASYALLANIYANAGRWTDVAQLDALRQTAGACKLPARAWIEVNSKVHSFMVGEASDDTSSKLSSVNSQVVGESKSGNQDALCGHAEKLALAYGLLNTPQGTTLLVTKSLRMCDDCHSGTKLMSRIEEREIIVRDAHRVHRFVNGFCSCGDRH